MQSQEDTGPVGGWVLVPREPTDAMILAGGAQLLTNGEYQPTGADGAWEIWREMIAAAPVPPTGRVELGEQSNTESSPETTSASSSRAEKIAVFNKLHSDPGIMRPEDDWRDLPAISPSPLAVVGTTPEAPSSSTEKIRECTCHPDDNPPRPCPRKFAYTECVKAPAVVDYTERARVACPPDIQEYGRRNGLPTFAEATWQAGYIEGLRAVSPSPAAMDYTTGDCPCGYGWNCKETGCRKRPPRDPNAWSDGDA